MSEDHQVDGDSCLFSFLIIFLLIIVVVYIAFQKIEIPQSTCNQLLLRIKKINVFKAQSRNKCDKKSIQKVKVDNEVELIESRQSSEIPHIIHQVDQQQQVIDQINTENINQYRKLKQELNQQFQIKQQNICQQTSSENVSGAINLIYKSTSHLRYIDENLKYYVRRLQDKTGLKKYYSLSLRAIKNLEKYCNAFREVRGDGNCFYTAFGYQFLSILLFDYSYDQFQQFIEKIKQIQLPMTIDVTGLQFQIDNKELEKELLLDFLNRLIKLKQIEDLGLRQEQFHTQFAAYEKQSEEVDACLYGLSTIFFRNYSNYVVDFSESKDAVFDRENLLKWEEECNSNEVVIAELAKQLNIFVQLIFIENTDDFVINKYGNEENNKIILLIKPGHYNIGYYQEQIIVELFLKQQQELYGLIKSYRNIEEAQREMNANKIQQLSQECKEYYNKIYDLIQKKKLRETDASKLLEFEI